MSDTPEHERPAAADFIEAISMPTHHGHESPFVQPSSYLRPKSTSRPAMPKELNPLDKDQMHGLVSGSHMRA